MRLQLRSADIKTLSSRVNVLLATLKSSFPAKWEDSGVRTVRTRDLEQFLSAKSIKIIYADMLGRDAEALIARIPSSDGKSAQVAILINEKVQELSQVARERTTKAILLHEICHFICSHQGAKAYKLQSEDEILKERFDSYKQLEPGQDAEAELMSAILAFWPNEEFNRQLQLTKGDFRCMANLYKMPVDCVLKWSVIQFNNQLVSHYFKWNVDAARIEDAYQEDAVGLFDDPMTAASRAIKSQCDENSDNQSYKCVCRAYYESKTHHFNKSSDRVLVIGLDRTMFDAFCGQSVDVKVVANK